MYIVLYDIDGLCLVLTYVSRCAVLYRQRFVSIEVKCSSKNLIVTLIRNINFDGKVCAIPGNC